MNNLYQVIREDDIDKILNDHDTKLVIVSYIIKQPEFYKQFKMFIKSLSGTFDNCFFAVIDLKNFENKTGKYLKNLKSLPKIVIYLNSEILGETTDKFNQKEIYDSILNINNMINEQFKNAHSNTSENSIKNKITHINNLCTPDNIAELEKINNDPDVINNDKNTEKEKTEETSNQ